MELSMELSPITASEYQLAIPPREKVIYREMAPPSWDSEEGGCFVFASDRSFKGSCRTSLAWADIAYILNHESRNVSQIKKVEPGHISTQRQLFCPPPLCHPYLFKIGRVRAGGQMASCLDEVYSLFRFHDLRKIDFLEYFPLTILQ